MGGNPQMCLPFNNLIIKFFKRVIRCFYLDQSLWLKNYILALFGIPIFLEPQKKKKNFFTCKEKLFMNIALR